MKRKVPVRIYVGITISHCNDETLDFPAPYRDSGRPLRILCMIHTLHLGGDGRQEYDIPPARGGPDPTQAIQHGHTQSKNPWNTLYSSRKTHGSETAPGVSIPEILTETAKPMILEESTWIS